MNKQAIFLLVIFMFLNVINSADVLSAGYWLPGIENVHQECSNLCWAACMEMIIDPTTEFETSQCELVEASWSLGGVGWYNCCDRNPFCCPECNQTNWLCIEPGSVEDIFLEKFNISSLCGYTLTKYYLRSTVSIMGQPFIINDGHMRVIIGYDDKSDGSMDVRYCDPWYEDGGFLITSYSDLIPSSGIENLSVFISTGVDEINDPIASLSSFNSRVEDGVVRFEFETRFEIDSHHFIMQKYRGPGEFEMIGVIKARGSEDKKTEYSFSDSTGTIDDKYRLIEVEDSGVCHILGATAVRENVPVREANTNRSTRRDINAVREETAGIIKSSAGILKAPASPQKENYEWLAIYPDSFESDVEDLMMWRSMHGLCAGGISIEEVNSNYGSIKDYIEYLWEAEYHSLEYICLVGSACYAGHEDLIPIESFHDGPGYGGTYYESDFNVGDANGDGNPEIAVGRIPAINCYDVASYVNKVITYESSPGGEWVDEATFFIDARERNSCSASLTDSLSQLIQDYIPPSYNLHRMISNDSTYYQEELYYEERQALAINEFNDGRSLILGFGNGAWETDFVDWIKNYTSENYFRIDSLDTNEIFPFVLGASCHICDAQGRCEGGIGRPLAKELLFDSERGAVAVFGPTGHTWQTGNYKIMKYTLSYLYDYGAKSAGYACMNAQKMVMAEWDIYDSTARSYIYLGDPAVKLKGTTIVTDVGDEEREDAGLKNLLGSNYPNPFNPTTTIEYSVAEDSEVDLSIYDVKGRLVRTLERGFKKAGSYKALWNGLDQRGREVSSGVYFYRLKTRDKIITRKMVLLK